MRLVSPVAASLVLSACTSQSPAKEVVPKTTGGDTAAAVEAKELGGPEVTEPMTLGADLDRFFYERRVLLVFAPTEEGMAPLRPMVERYRPSMNERDMVLVEIVGARVRVDGQESYGNAEAFRRRWSPTPDHLTSVLVGKDGQEKARDVDGIPLTAMFALIDTMPMRQREMRERASR